MSGVVTAVVAVTATAYSISEQRKARKQQRRAAKVAQKRADLERRRAAVASVEDARQLIGSLQNVAAQTGGQGGSGTLGAQGSVAAQLGANLTFNEQLNAFAQQQASYLDKAAKAQFNAQAAAQIAQVAASFMSFSGSQGGAKFSKPTSPNTTGYTGSVTGYTQGPSFSQQSGITGFNIGF